MMRVTVTVAWAPLLAGRGGAGGRRGRCELLSSTKAAAAGPGPGREARGVRRQVPGGAVYAGEGGRDGQVRAGDAGDGQVRAGRCRGRAGVGGRVRSAGARFLVELSTARA